MDSRSCYSSGGISLSVERTGLCFNGASESDEKDTTDLILHDCVPNLLCKVAHSVRVCVIFLVSSRARSLRNGQQLVLDPFKSPEVLLMCAPAPDTRTRRTPTGLSFVRIHLDLQRRCLLHRACPTSQGWTQSFPVPLVVSIGMSVNIVESV